ncbi:MAG: hypothetical protein IT170_03925 [Bryobacterales bacterium]|nr:hypothetical protein [Bryobacterales bacterium]
MRTQALRWMTLGLAFTLSTGMLAAQSGRGSSGRGGFGSLDQGVAGGERGSSVAGPTLGYVVDASTGNLHMVSGIAGSSTMGAPVHRGSAIQCSAIAPSADYAVVSDESGKAWFYGQSGPRGAAGAELADLSGVTQLATSPSGDGFAAYAATSGRISVYAVSNGAPRLERSFTVALTAPVSRIALADGLKDPALLTRDASGTSLLRASAEGVRSVAVLPGATELAFFRGSERAVILDAAQNAVYEADLALQNPALALVASSAQGIESPVGLALSDDNRTIAVASAANRKATLIDLATRASTQLDLPEAPTGVRRMNSRAVFQLTDAHSGPMLLLDVQGDSARTVYVPLRQGGRGAAGGRASLQ